MKKKHICIHLTLFNLILKQFRLGESIVSWVQTTPSPALRKKYSDKSDSVVDPELWKGWWVECWEEMDVGRVFWEAGQKLCNLPEFFSLKNRNGILVYSELELGLKKQMFKRPSSSTRLVVAWSSYSFSFDYVYMPILLYALDKNMYSHWTSLLTVSSWN